MKTANDEDERKTISDIQTYGVHVVNVIGDEDYPRFSYTVGLFENYVHPEIIIIGLKHEVAHGLLNNMAFEMKFGKRYLVGEFYDDILDNYLCYFGEVPKSEYREHVGWANWFYSGDGFPLIQCVYPTVSGKFAWDKDFPEEAAFFCKLLIKPPLEH